MYCIKLGVEKGYSVFATKVFKKNDVIGEYLSSTYNEIGRQLYNGMYETNILGRYCNHSDIPNTKLVKINEDTVILVATTEIQNGCEIVVDYKEVEVIVGVPYLTYYREHFTNEILYSFAKQNKNLI